MACKRSRVRIPSAPPFTLRGLVVDLSFLIDAGMVELALWFIPMKNQMFL